MEHITRCEEEVILSIFRLGEIASLQTVMDEVYYIPEISLEQYCRECISERCRVLFDGDMEEFVQCAEKSKDSCHWKRGGRG